MGNVQSLWGGYGSIDRYELRGANVDRIIVKHIEPPGQSNHPRGWNTNFGHQRKLRSYEVEATWYRDWSKLSDDHCRMPRCLAVYQDHQETLILLEDLDDAGFARRPTHINLDAMIVCLQWLASFHMTFLGKAPEGLWHTGSYWHLETRPEELEQLNDLSLKTSAEKIDQVLKDCPYQTIIHGDAKLANFCFSGNLRSVAAVDFQYVGGGIGIKDVVYFIGSCLDEDACEKYENYLLQQYFQALRQAFIRNPDIQHITFDDLESEWRRLFPVAWTDFHRFLKGWSPGHWKINSYSERLASQVLSNL
ncbi:MAG: phosphotransferase [Saprospiraceae bacterium]|nr:phosphotransferase [Saprospiraceae bacterium]